LGKDKTHCPFFILQKNRLKMALSPCSPPSIQPEGHSNAHGEKAVLLAGCTGNKAFAINGIFLRRSNTEENGKDIFVKMGCPALCIRCTPFNRWIVCTFNEQNATDGVGFAVSAEVDVGSPTDVAGWMVCEGLGTWSVQPSLSCVTLSEAETAVAEETAVGKTSVLALIKGWVVEGATGPNAATINGLFARGDEVVNGKPVYVKIDDGGWCFWYSPHTSWVVSATMAKARNKPNGIMASTCYGKGAPADVSGWNVIDRTGIHPCSTLTVTSLNDIWRLSRFRIGGFLQFPLLPRSKFPTAEYMVLWPWNKTALWSVYLICNRLIRKPTLRLKRIPPQMWETILGMIAVKDLGHKPGNAVFA
jgi:hypothetical protein